MPSSHRDGKSAVPLGKEPSIKGTCSCASLRRLTRRVTQYYDNALRPSGLRVTQYSILAHIAEAADLSLTELAARLDMDRTTLTRNLRPLEKAHWVELTAGPDRRSRSVRLTRGGAQRLKDAGPLWRAAEQGFRRTVGRDESAALRRLIAGAMSSLSSRDP